MSEEVNKVKALTKISSALENIDNICVDGNTDFNGKLKRDLIRFTNWFVYHTSEATTNMSKSDGSAFYDLTYYWVGGIDETVEASSETKKNLALFYCKCLSASEDLSKLSSNMSNKILFSPITVKLNSLFNRIERRLGILKEDLLTLKEEVDVVSSSVIFD